jgi:hypothetical protein
VSLSQKSDYGCENEIEPDGYFTNRISSNAIHQGVVFDRTIKQMAE